TGRPEAEAGREVPIPSEPPKNPEPPEPPKLPLPGPGEPPPIPKAAATQKSALAHPSPAGPIYLTVLSDLQQQPPGDDPGDEPPPGPAPRPTPPKPKPRKPPLAIAAAARARAPSPPPVSEHKAGEPVATGNAVYRIDPQGFVTEIFRQNVLV